MERAVQSFGDCFAELRDPRGPNAKRHDLPEIMTIALCAVLAGGQELWAEVGDGLTG
jgi:DDE family transposase